MKIALFLETYLSFINGVKTHVYTLKKGLEKLGHEVLVVCALPGIKKHYIKDGVLCCPSVSIKKIYNYGLAGPISPTRFKYIKNFKPDIIHIHTEFGIGISGAYSARLLKIPYVYTLHTMYDDYVYYIAPKKLIHLAKKTAHFYVKLLAKKATCIVGPSVKVEYFLRSCGVDKKVYIVPNSVELSLFCEDKICKEKTNELKKTLGIDRQETIACFCGRLGKEKRVEVLLKYWSSLKKENKAYKLLIFGDGPLKKELLKTADDLNLSGSVTFLGKINHNDLPLYYSLCDFYITASLSEVHSISTLEAMASGLPVFHIYDEKNKDQIIDGINGFIYEDFQQLKQKLQYFEDMDEDQKSPLKIARKNLC